MLDYIIIIFSIQLILKISKEIRILIFDSECLFCQGFLKILDQIFINSDKHLIISSNPSNILGEFNDIKKINFLKSKIEYMNQLARFSIIYIEDKKIYIRSQAILMLFILSKHFLLAPISKIVKIFLPTSIGDLIYRVFASRRKYLSKVFFKNNCTFKYKNLKIIN